MSHGDHLHMHILQVCASNLVILVAAGCCWSKMNGEKILVDFGMQIYCGRWRGRFGRGDMC